MPPDVPGGNEFEEPSLITPIERVEDVIDCVRAEDGLDARRGSRMCSQREVPSTPKHTRVSAFRIKRNPVPRPDVIAAPLSVNGAVPARADISRLALVVAQTVRAKRAGWFGAAAATGQMCH